MTCTGVLTSNIELTETNENATVYIEVGRNIVGFALNGSHTYKNVNRSSTLHAYILLEVKA
jgi:hypothetical protein